MNSNRPPDHRYDVAILGAGIAGSMLAATLARNGVDVLLVDAGEHPRFAVGESTIPYTSVMMKIVAERYGVPEIAHLASSAGVQKHVSTACGVKRNFGFVYHREGQAQNPEEINQFVIPKLLSTENHFFRQDVDAYMFAVAARYGATVRTRTAVTGVAIDDTGVRLTTRAGEELLARYVVDASGHRSPLAQQFGLHENPTRFRHHSRSLFTHMVGVRPFDEVMEPAQAYANPSPWHQGTLHHIFDGGWLWVIPFDNHSGSRNPLCSVGLTLDPRRHPKPEGSAQQEFEDFLRRFPQIAPQFADATPVREWVSTDRLQYSLRSTVGDRYCVTAHAAGFIDALFSRGLTNTLEIVNALTWRLIEACEDDDFSAERFRFVERLEQELLDSNDDLVNSAFIGFGDYRLWDATFRVWAVSAVLGTFHLQNALNDLRRTGKDSAVRELEDAKYLGSPFPVHEEANELLRSTTETCLAVQAGELDPGEASEAIFARLRRATFIPPTVGLADRTHKFFHMTPGRAARTARWAHRSAPPEIGRMVTGALRGFASERLHRHG